MKTLQVIMKCDLRILCILNAPIFQSIYSLYQYSQRYSWTNHKHCNTKRIKQIQLQRIPLVQSGMYQIISYCLKEENSSELTVAWVAGNSKYKGGCLCVCNSYQFILSEDSMKMITLHSGYENTIGNLLLICTNKN